MLNIVFSVGIGLTITSVLLYIQTLVDRKKNKFGVVASLNPLIANQKDELTKWINQMDKIVKRNGLRIKVKKFLLVNIFLFTITLIISIRTFKNLTASIFLAISFFIIPEYVLFLYADYRKRKIEDQMVSAIRIFDAEFTQTRSIEKAFAATSRRSVGQIGIYFADAYTDRLTGVGLDDVLLNLSSKVDSRYWKMFIQLIRQLKEDYKVVTLLPDLISKIETHIELSRNNVESVSAEKIVSLIMALLPIPAFYLMNNIIPETTQFVTENSIGRLFITISFLSLFIYIVLDRIIMKVD